MIRRNTLRHGASRFNGGASVTHPTRTGYYDRTLAAWSRKPRVIGVGDSGAAIATIYPLLHDIPMDEIVTDALPLMR